MRLSRYFLLLFCASSLLLGCGGQSAAETEQDQISAAPDVEGAEGTASVNLSWAGTYEGITPCADCSGIKTTLILSTDKQYELTVSYLGKGDGKPTTVKGSWIWKTGNIVELIGESFGADQFFISEEKALVLDEAGNKVEGELADKYVLKKIK